jgi:ABC-type multidrug transport system fused ATPase/permease subunit
VAKIALSRAFMRDSADILVLDEPTSAMDAQAEFDIFNHFRSLTKNQMVLLISHRFSTVRMADKIVVIENGEVIEQGTHEELLQAEGRYASLFYCKQRGISSVGEWGKGGGGSEGRWGSRGR